MRRRCAGLPRVPPPSPYRVPSFPPKPRLRLRRFRPIRSVDALASLALTLTVYLLIAGYAGHVVRLCLLHGWLAFTSARPEYDAAGCDLSGAADTGRAAQAGGARTRPRQGGPMAVCAVTEAAKAAASGIAWFVPPAPRDGPRAADRRRRRGAVRARAGARRARSSACATSWTTRWTIRARGSAAHARRSIGSRRSCKTGPPAAKARDALLATGVFRTADAVARFRAAPASACTAGAERRGVDRAARPQPV